MIRSMTGFGLSKSLKKDSEVFIEIKGVNHRFLEVSIKPNDLGNELDQYIRNSITKSVNRGKVDVRVKLKSSSQTNYSINTSLIKNLENTLTKNDILIIVMDDEPNDSLITRMKYLYEQEGVFIVIHNIKRLQYNVLEHSLVPQATILTDDELNELKVKYNIKDLSQLPEVSRFDPQSLAICLRPGQVCKYTRKSVASLEHDYYRVCIN